jgi:hypothetical protein
MKNIMGLTAVIFFLASQFCFSQTDSLKISWDRNSEEDIVYYVLYRAVAQDTNLTIFDYDSIMKINQPQPGISRVGTVDRDNSAILPGNFLSYVVVAIDTGGLRSIYSDPDDAGIPKINWTVNQISSGGTTNIPLSSFLFDPDDDISQLLDSIWNSVNIEVSRNGNLLSLTPDTSATTDSASFILRFSDLEGYWDIDTIEIELVISANQPPIISTLIPDQTIMEGENFIPINLDDYVFDPDNPDDEINWTYSGNDSLIININANRVVTISVPYPEWNGADTIVFVATDPGGLSVSDTAIFKVTGVNDPPVISGLIPDQTIMEGENFIPINLDDYVSDPDNPDDEIVWTTSGDDSLILSINANRIANITVPNPDWNGADTIIFIASDPGGLSVSDTAIFKVTGVNDPPVITSDPDTIVSHGSYYSYQVVVSDPDLKYGDVLTFTFLIAPGFLNINNNIGLISGMIPQDTIGIFPVTVEVKDISNTSDTQQYNLSVVSGSTPLVSDIPDQTITQGFDFNPIYLDDFVTDDTPDDEIVWTYTGNTNLVVDINPMRIAIISATNTEWTGSETVVFTATDPIGLHSSDAVKFTVIEKPDLDSMSVNWSPEQLSANFLIFTDVETRVNLEYWIELTLIHTFRSPQFAKEHNFTIPGLSSDTTYSFRLSLEDSLGFMSEILDSVFRTGSAALIESVGEPFAFPNPYRPSHGHDQVFFDNIPSDAEKIVIFDVATNEVYSHNFRGTPTRRWGWNVINDDGKELASGLYIYVIFGPGNKKIKSGKIAVIR